MPRTEDLSVFFDVDEDATAATLAGVAVTGIFDNANAPGTVGVFGMASTQPSYTLPTASVPSNPIGATLVIGSASYLVVSHEIDGTGVSALLLEKSA